MKRAMLDAEIARIEASLPALKERFGQRSKEYVFALERLKTYRHDRMMRDLNWRRGTKRKAA